MTQLDNEQQPFVFRATANKLPLLSAIGGLGFLGITVFLLWYYLSPYNTEVGYSPKQPIPYSHKLHAGDLGIDCRYCHTNVEKAAVAMVPPTQTCLNCHSQIKQDSPLLAVLHQKDKAKEKEKAKDKEKDPIPWIRVHKVPDYAYFPHESHVNKGVGCEECHGRIDQMVQVKQVAPLSMGWCLNCHRNPGPHLRPVSEVTKMGWQPPLGETRESFGAKLLLANDQKPSSKIKPPTDCSRCHR